MDKYFPHKELSYKIIGLLYKVRTDYGNSQKEIIYQNALVEELEEAKIPYKREVDIPIISAKTKKRLGNYRADFLIDNKIILEIKAIKFTFNKLEQQVFSYLKSTPYEIAYLANFGSPQFYFKRYILTNDRKSVSSVPHKSVESVSSKSVSSVSLGITFIELMVVATLIAILIVVGITLFNPLKQIQKSHDGKRTSELNTLQKVLEDYYNDKNRFPLPADICFDAASAPRTDLYGQTACSCHICGNSAQSPNFSPYLSSLPCDPQSPQKEYLYDYDCSTASPNWYRIYTKLAIESNPNIIQVGCGGNCGPSPDFAYNYVVSSNAKPETISCSDYIRLWQTNANNYCNICKSPIGGDRCNYSENTYYQSNCTSECSP